MATDEYVLTVNPDPTKHGVRIEKAKYDIMREAILENLRTYGPMTFAELGELLEDQLQGDYEGSVMWYYTTVKLDMEVRGELCRVPKSRPQYIGFSGGVFY